MRIPEEGSFWQEEGSIYAENDVTKDKVIYLKDEEENLCLRSMAQEDVDIVMESYGANPRRRKGWKKRLDEKDSQFSFFILEELYEDENGDLRIIGDCQLLENGECHLNLYIRNYYANEAYAHVLRARAYTVVKKVLAKLMIAAEPKIFRISKAI